MSYSINKTDGTLLVEIVDSAIDQTATDLTLIGKNVSGYGEFINENFVKILENFANESSPNNAITGQLWFDTSENRLKVYDGNGWKIGSGPIVSGTQPINLVQGDFWIDSVENQLYFYDGIDLQLAGPIYKNSQGLSGNKVETILDTNKIPRNIVKYYVGNVLLGIYSADVVTYTPQNAISGFSGTIGPGFNQGTLTGQKFRVTVTRSEALIDALGNLKTPYNFMKTDENTSTTGVVSIANSVPLVLGVNSENEFQISPLLCLFQSNAINQNFRLKVRQQQGFVEALTILTQQKYMGIWTQVPAYPLDVTGDVRITGNLIVKGNTTAVNSTNLVINDHRIELAVNSDSSNSDANADQGGIVLKGTTDHTLIWSDSNDTWTSSENFDIVHPTLGSRAYKINGTSVLEYDGAIYKLSASVTSAPGITNFGPQTSLTVDNLFFNNNKIESTNVNGDIEIEPNGAGNVVLIGSPRITGLADPVSNQDAATKSYVTTYVRARNIALSMDITGLTNTNIETILEDIAPYTYYEVGTEARIHCTTQNISYPAVTLTTTIAPVTTGDFVKHFISVDKGGLIENQAVLDDFDVNPLNLGAATVSVTRINKLFRIVTVGMITKWTWQSDY